jgi:glycosyltransferase involved in cell wall biosynthesis
MQPVFSIVIPAYNVAGYIEKCMDSILAQTFRDFEVIIVDDGSTDDTPMICDRYAQLDDRTTVIHKNNKGVSAARNTGIEKVQGEFILFFDGDDFTEPYTCEELFRIAREKDADTVIYGYHRFENGKVKETCPPIFDEGHYRGESILDLLLPRFIGVSSEGVNHWLKNEKNALYVENPALWRIMVSSRVVKENGILFDKNLRVGEDTVFITEYLSYAQSCYVYPKCYYYLVTRETSTIYVYEKDPMAKLGGKIRLLDSRKKLTGRILARRNLNISQYWYGTVIMSCIELAFLFAKKDTEHRFFSRYRMFLQYVKMKDVDEILRKFRLMIVPGIRVIPFLLLKWRGFFLLFCCTSILQMLHYEFKRV